MSAPNCIKGDALREALARIAGRTPFVSDYRRASNGRLVRFVNLNRRAGR